MWFISDAQAWILHNPAATATLVATAVACVTAWVTLRVNASINIRNKRMDVIVHCNARYDDLYKLRMEIDELSHKVKKTHPLPSDSVAPDNQKRSLFSYVLGLKKKQALTNEELIFNHKVEAYFRRYWGLKTDELDYWLAGYIDPETMASWLMYTVEALAGTGSRIHEESYFAHFGQLKESHEVVNQRFVEMVEFLASDVILLSGRDRYTAILFYLDTLERAERDLINQLKRHSLDRFWVNDIRKSLLSPVKERYESIMNMASEKYGRHLGLFPRRISMGEAVSILRILQDNRDKNKRQ